jgi:hypothetical protein
MAKCKNSCIHLLLIPLYVVVFVLAYRLLYILATENNQREDEIMENYAYALKRGKKIISSVATELIDNWGWAGGRLICPTPIPKNLGLTREDVGECATSSCRPDLWAFRAWCDKRGIPIKIADWYWYNVG